MNFFFLLLFDLKRRKQYLVTLHIINVIVHIPVCGTMAKCCCCLFFFVLLSLSIAWTEIDLHFESHYALSVSNKFSFFFFWLNGLNLTHCIFMRIYIKKTNGRKRKQIYHHMCVFLIYGKPPNLVKKKTK